MTKLVSGRIRGANVALKPNLYVGLQTVAGVGGEYMFGRRAKKIRTYDYVHDRVVDHRSGVVVHGVERVLRGDLDGLTEPLRVAREAERLARVGVPSNE